LLSPPGRAGVRRHLQANTRQSDVEHKVASVVFGAIGGFFGMPGLILEFTHHDNAHVTIHRRDCAGSRRGARGRGLGKRPCAFGTPVCSQKWICGRWNRYVTIKRAVISWNRVRNRAFEPCSEAFSRSSPDLTKCVGTRSWHRRCQLDSDWPAGARDTDRDPGHA
jgi:hypothetical protein